MSWWLVSHGLCQDIFAWRLFATSSLPPHPHPLFILPMFSSFRALFVYIHSGWKSQTQEDAARNKAALSLSLAFPFLFFLTEMQPTGHALGFQTKRVCWGSLESNPTIIVGWSGLASTVKRKWIACYGAFQTNPLQGLCRLNCRIYPFLTQQTNHPACD